MAKIRNLFNLLERLLCSEAKSKLEKREKRRRWIFGRFRWKRLPIITAPSLVEERRLSEAEKEQSKHALTVAIATTAAAEAAVAAAQAAAEVVRLTGTLQSYVRNQKGRRELAAIKIQTAYRGYLARKALRALKGLVRLQAIVRGQAVRRQAITTLKGLQSLVRIQSQVQARRTKLGASQLSKQDKRFEETKTMIQLTSQSGRDDTLPTKEEIDGMFFSRQEALIKAERLKEYLLSLRETRNTRKLEESEADEKLNRNLGHWLKQWVDAQEQNSKRDFVICSNLLKKNGERKMEHIGLREIQNHESLARKGFEMSPPRRSFHKPKQSSIGDKDSLGSPVIPNYMSATESAKARLRSSSMPKQRVELLENFSEHGSPSKNRLSFSSINSDTSTIIKSGKAPVSPHTKGLLLPIKSDRKAKDISINSESSLQNWHRQSV